MTTKQLIVSSEGSEVWVNGEPATVTVVQSGPIGPPGIGGGPGGSSDHNLLTNVTTSQHHVRYSDAEAVAAAAASGDFMETLIYDAGGAAVNVYDLANATGNLDGGTFT